MSETHGTTQISYGIAVAPSATPLDEQTAPVRAKQIGALVGLTDIADINQSPTLDGTWIAHFAQEWDGIAVADSSIELDMNPDGTVDRFYCEIGPRAPKPAKLITKAQAEGAVPEAKVSSAQLEWDRAGTDVYHVVWFLRIGEPGADTGAVWVDAGTGKVLDAAAVS